MSLQNPSLDGSLSYQLTVSYMNENYLCTYVLKIALKHYQVKKIVSEIFVSQEKQKMMNCTWA
jgi:hypothetical protein